jgi:hypothetical protein
MKRALLIALLLASACAHVPRYRRETLAHHSMREPEYVGQAEQHLRAVQEGALGSVAKAAEGGGCNLFVG